MKDWKLKLRYGKNKTSFKHYTSLADGVVGELKEGYACRPGKAWMGMKTWASSSDESIDMIKYVGNQIGFQVTGRIEVFESDPEEPPKENPFGYDIQFTPYDEEK